jgi:hypothetical protein
VTVILGVWLALAGGVALLAGLVGARRRRRLQDTGLTAWAMVLSAPYDAAEESPAFGNGVSVQFALEDGRVIERGCHQPRRTSARLRPGERVLVWYDAADPGDVLVYGSDGRWSDLVFVVLGAVALGVGVVLAGLHG